MSGRNSGPESHFYDSPYIPNQLEREEWETLFLQPVEAHTLLVNNIGNLSFADTEALRIIANSDEPADTEMDFLALVREIETR